MSWSANALFSPNAEPEILSQIVSRILRQGTIDNFVSLSQATCAQNSSHAFSACLAINSSRLGMLLCLRPTFECRIRKPVASRRG